MDFTFRVGGVTDLEEAARLASFLQPTMYVSAQMLESFLAKFPRWYLTFAEAESGEVVAYDIRYAVDDEMIIVHQSGVLPQYLVTGVWRELIFHAHEKTLRDGYRRVCSHMQDYSGDSIHLISELQGRVIGYQHNRWVQAGVRCIGSLTFEMTDKGRVHRPARLRKANFSGLELVTSSQAADGWQTYAVYRDRTELSRGRFLVGSTSIHLETDDLSDEGVVAICCTADLLEQEYRLPISVPSERMDLLASMISIYLFACGFQSETNKVKSKIYMHRRYPQGFLQGMRRSGIWVSKNE